MRSCIAARALTALICCVPGWAGAAAPASQAPAAAMQAQAAAIGAKSGADLSGVWQVSGGVGNEGRGMAAYPQSQWSREELPFTAEGRKAFVATRPGKGPRYFNPAAGNDPIGGANPPGLYRTLVYGRPFEFIQLGDKVIQQFEWGRIWRDIYTDGRPVPDDVPTGPFWYGYSVGRWEGTTLVATTMALDGRAWFDEWGTPISDEARVEERWQRTGPDALQLQITVRDPKMYTRPWTSVAVSFRRQRRGVEPGEIIFSPMDENTFNERIRDPAGSATSR